MHIIKSYAKINLFLRIIGKRQDGYHLLQSIFAFCHDFYDEIQIVDSGKLEVTTIGAEIEEEQNLVFKALKKFDLKAKIIIKKNIPIGAGLGGGSSNVGFLLKKLKPELEPSDLAQIGADILPCYKGRACLVGGIGDIIEREIDIPKVYSLIMVPNFSIFTPSVYKRFTPSDIVEPVNVPEKFDIELFKKFIKSQINSLFKPALEVKPELLSLINQMKNLEGCFFSLMSGSGSSIFGLFEDQVKLSNAFSELKEKFPNYSIFRTSLF